MMKFYKGLLVAFTIIFSTLSLYAQQTLKGVVINSKGNPVQSATVMIEGTDVATSTDTNGEFALPVSAPKTTILIRAVGFFPTKRQLAESDYHTSLTLSLRDDNQALEEVVVSGTLKEMSKLESPVNVEVYTSKFFKANPTPSLFDALQNINGVRPQLNCNVCNTGDIHINGLEGPYTMILIDGMPIVSGLASVYGLSGIPQSLIDRVEIVKGPASTLYGSEAVGGLINVITKRPENAPLVSADVFGTTWGEVNADIAGKFNVGQRAQSLLGVNYFNYQNPVDNNNDNFTDVTLQNRISVFNKWSFNLKDDRVFSLAGRYVYEDRWGGEMNWSKKYRGGDEVYGESVYTSRWELFGTYQLPLKEKVIFQFSTNGHDQNSVYGDTFYLADQFVGFGQLTWFKTLGKHDLLTGIAYRYNYFDDNTAATAGSSNIELNQPSRTHLPGVFIQDEIALNKNNKLLLGARYDYNSIHGHIVTPRVNYKWNSSDNTNILRVSVGNGYRVANVFTEDHAALTGAREVVFMNELKPETSWNGNINFVKKVYVGNTQIGFDATAFHTYFTNKIIPDYDTDTDKIIYDNIDGYAVSQGVSLNLDVVFPFGLKILAGGTAMDVYNTEEGEKIRQMFAEKFTGTWNIGYTFNKTGITLDYTGNLYGPMRLPLLNEEEEYGEKLDPRREYSPWWSIQNIQITRRFGEKIEVYGGVKNLLNWTPDKGNPFIIARAHDPFDKHVVRSETTGKVVVTDENPYAQTFDPSYVYGPNQGIRAFLGFRYNLF